MECAVRSKMKCGTVPLCLYTQQPADCPLHRLFLNLSVMHTLISANATAKYLSAAERVLSFQSDTRTTKLISAFCKQLMWYIVIQGYISKLCCTADIVFCSASLWFLFIPVTKHFAKFILNLKQDDAMWPFWLELRKFLCCILILLLICLCIYVSQSKQCGQWSFTTPQMPSRFRAPALSDRMWCGSTTVPHLTSCMSWWLAQTSVNRKWCTNAGSPAFSTTGVSPASSI